MSATAITAITCFILGLILGVYGDFRCAWSALRWSIKFGHRDDGHNWHDATRMNNCVVTVMQCKWCHRYDVSWEPTSKSTPHPYPWEHGTREGPLT